MAKQMRIYDGSQWVEVASSTTDLSGYATIDLGNPTGSMTMFAAPIIQTIASGIATSTAPTGWLLCDGGTLNRTNYQALFDTICPSRGAVTITIASPGVITLTNHNLDTGDAIFITTTGALPTGLTANTNYYVINVTSSTFRLATSLSNALAGTAINTSGTQSGTHTLYQSPYLIGSSTTFNLPNFTGKSPVGTDTTQDEFIIGRSGGSKTSTAQHTHTINHDHLGGATNIWYNSGAAANIASGTSTNRATVANTTTGFVSGGSNVEVTSGNLHPYLAVNYIIKT